jgi:hypothetical protein
MRIPIYEEIPVQHYSLIELRKALAKSNLGKGPCYIAIHSEDQEYISKALDNIANTLKDIGYQDSLPYPLFIVCDQVHSHPELDIFPDVSSLPKHFFKKAKRLNKKELALLSKSTLLSSKLSNIDTKNIKAEIAKLRENQQDLYKACMETSFYKDILQELKLLKERQM